MSEKWEDICLRCGLCCHEKVVTPEFLLIDSCTACEYLDTASNSCSVYKERFSICNRCQKVGLAKAMFSPALPSTCGYVLWARRHHIRFAKTRETVLESGVLGS